jgi:uncharacterized protein YxjI
MIEHRLYSIERFVPNYLPTFTGSVRDEMLIMTPKKATWYALQGYKIFDYTASLEMDPVYYDEECELTMDQV